MFFSSNKELVEALIEEGYLKTPAIIDAFLNIDRGEFIPDELKDKSYENYPLPIGFNQTISQPLTVAFMLEQLNPLVGEKILDVGTGSGWQTSLLAYIISNYQFTSLSGKRFFLSDSLNKKENNQIVKRYFYGRNPQVISIERIKELKERAEKNISKFNFIKEGIVKIVLGDGSKGYEPEAPYDRIISGADCGPQIPQEWKDQLKINGRIVVPSAGRIVVLDKKSANEFKEKVYHGFNFVPLIRESS